eukprot:GHVS01094462.1.p1 GENE.GHVS01094462.1~~GHVS01094462.1.p1  ORF type:complete len:211 (+),score=43.28 GHVS01094462.1:42-635(+)
MSDYHPESWNPSWRVESILTAFLSFMLDPADPRTAGSVRSTSEARRQLALQSFVENKTNNSFARLFPEFTDNSKYDPSRGFFLLGPSRPPSSYVSPSSPFWKWWNKTQDKSTTDRMARYAVPHVDTTTTSSSPPPLSSSFPCRTSSSLAVLVAVVAVVVGVVGVVVNRTPREAEGRFGVPGVLRSFWGGLLQLLPNA